MSSAFAEMLIVKDLFEIMRWTFYPSVINELSCREQRLPINLNQLYFLTFEFSELPTKNLQEELLEAHQSDSEVLGAGVEINGMLSQ